jgi:hypothetical protein
VQIVMMALMLSLVLFPFLRRYKLAPGGEAA